MDVDERQGGLLAQRVGKRAENQGNKRITRAPLYTPLCLCAKEDGVRWKKICDWKLSVSENNGLLSCRYRVILKA